jgi:L-aspartate oxidase
MQQKTDFLIIGSGIAGLSYALKVADAGKVTILTKSDPDETNTKYAQGGIAVVINESDNIEKHVQDTLTCGDGICDEAIVRMVVSEARDRINELIEWGADFDRTPSGNFDLGKEGGHSEHRILHHKDITGFEIERALLEKIRNHPNIQIYDHYYAVDIITQHHLGEYINSSTPDINCYGAYVLNLKTQQVEIFLSKVTLMASGGAGQVYSTTTNPLIATGDGVAMVYRAKGKVENMEFFQFHPTALYTPGENPSFLITEAMRGHGAVLRTRDGKEFMQRYDERKSLASRDIVARAIDNEMKIRGEDFVYLDCTGIKRDELIKQFPNIFNKCLLVGIDISKDYIPVAPAAHYLCGGIKVDMNGKSTIKNLFAVGECASTGLHGANRLASNSLLEAVVFSHRAAMASKVANSSIEFKDGIPEWNAEGTANPEEMVLITQSLRELKGIMTNYVGIVRSDLRLKRAFDRLLILHQETEELYQRTTLFKELCELRNMIKVGYIIIKQAIQRKESIGLHYNIDFPKKEVVKEL